MIVNLNLKNIFRVKKNMTKMDLSHIGIEGVADVRKNFTTQGGNIGLTWEPLKVRAGDALRNVGIMMNSTSWVQKGGVIYVLVRRVRRWKGKVINIAQIQNDGCVINVTAKMRNFLHTIGIHLKKSTTKIVIPPRKFMAFSWFFKREVLRWIKKEVMS